MLKKLLRTSGLFGIKLEEPKCDIRERAAVDRLFVLEVKAGRAGELGLTPGLKLNL